jgi:hypothetical protein
LLELRIPSSDLKGYLLADCERQGGGFAVGVRAKIGAGLWDLLFCQDCLASWTDNDVDYTWTDDPEEGQVECPTCGSTHVIREERG